MKKMLEINIVGPTSVKCDGIELSLVSSRKTRALLAYLLITEQPHPREHLCELFFENTNDPRGALRWSLSKLRLLLQDGDQSKLITDQDTVAINTDDIVIDYHFVRTVHNSPNPSTEDLRRAAVLLSHKPLASLELPRAEDFENWLLGEQEELQSLRGDIIQKLANMPEIDGAEAVKWLRLWGRMEPLSHDAPFSLWQKLTTLGRHDEATGVAGRYKALMGVDARQWVAPTRDVNPPSKPDLPRQTIGFCKAVDGVRIAYATVGSGPPLVKTANWLNHLDLDWKSPIWGEMFRRLAEKNTFIRYDERGNGLSDWEVPEISFDYFVKDLETVVENQSLDRFPLLGMSQGCAVSIAYAVRYPERVSALILIGGYASGWRIDMSKEERERREAVLTLTRLGWGTSNPAYRHIFSQTFMPNADAERLAWFDDFQRKTTSPENAVRFQEAFGDIDVRQLLPHVKAPTLVLHARSDQRIPLDHGRELAVGIPNARMVTLESSSHIILDDEPAWQICMDEIDQFLEENR